LWYLDDSVVYMRDLILAHIWLLDLCSYESGVTYNLLDTWLRCWGHPSRVQLQTTVVETHMTKMPTLAVKDRVRVTMTCGNMLSVHTTYPLWGWARSGASKCGTKMVGGSGVGAGEEGADLTFPKTHGRLHSPGATSCGRMRPRPGKAGWCHGS
jgi:hypothetical protein